MMTLYSARCIGNERNCLYPQKTELRDEEAFRRAVSHDYVAVAYQDSYRQTERFLSSDCLAMDCDNDHSDREEDWITPEKLQAFFGGVAMGIHFSRHHMQQKGNRSPRPRFHCLLAIRPTDSAEAYAELKRRVAEIFPFFDRKALDAARFFYGTSRPQVQLFPGPLTLDQWLEQREHQQRETEQATASASRDTDSGRIPEGKRNVTLSRYAAKVLKRFGNSEKAEELFLKRAEDCDPPLEREELRTIWKSALGFWKRISESPDYIPPEAYDGFEEAYTYQPSDKSDVAEARVLAEVFHERLRYSEATGFLVYNGKIWEENTPRAHALMHDLSDMQLQEAEEEFQRLQEESKRNGLKDLLDQFGNRAGQYLNEEQKRTLFQKVEAEEYRKTAMRYRQSRNIKAVLDEVQPMVLLRPEELDRDPYLLNTPEGTYDLRDGLRGKREFRPEDYMTRMTAVAPGREGARIWDEALNTFFQGDEQLKEYVQMVAGLIAVGEVRREEMIIAYGEGRNGKSTFWNVLSKVLGNYSGSLSADVLTQSCRRNVKPELADIRGKRMLIASELEEGLRLNTAMVKQLCSTDRVRGEAKYKAPFDFDPSHTLVLYTNHLPKVGSTDAGIWRRLIVIPFQAKIQGAADRKNYAKELLDKAGGAILSWIIEGAEKIIRNQFQLELPPCVQQAIHQYRSDNDWMTHFLEERCRRDPHLSERSGNLYAAYRRFCAETGEYTRSNADFIAALDAEGFVRVKREQGFFIRGLQLNPEPDEFSEAV